MRMHGPEFHKSVLEIFRGGYTLTVFFFIRIAIALLMKWIVC